MVPNSARLAMPFNGFLGATWIFKDAAGTWGQVAKLVGTDNIGNSQQGTSVSLSSDGLTLAVGGYIDNNSTGATWIFKDTAGTWGQVTKLVGTGNIGNSLQGSSVSLSSDGLTLAVGGYGDNGFLGATWIFKDRAGNWGQVTNLVGTGNIGSSEQGRSVSLSSDGLTLAVGGYIDNNSTGATWIFTSK